MNLTNEYITPQFAAEAVYEFARTPWKHKFQRLTMKLSSHSFEKTEKVMTCSQTCRIEFESYEPYQNCAMTISADIRNKEGIVTVHGAGIHSQHVFPSDADCLELWLVQFRCFLRREFQKDKDND